MGQSARLSVGIDSGINDDKGFTMLDFIPIDLRKNLEADAAQAQKNGDRHCAGILLQLAVYTGNDAPQWARDLGAEACTNRYDSARELMNLVVQAEAEREKKPRK